ncbi:MAG: hypothetical protein LBQ57_09245 [Spirochaetales bacterium]|jgi:hypothetical protein|nr:hypothetical protein [Spirochaetales bacterium]
MSIINDKENGEARSHMPAEDLEQYGVWVKAGPETVQEEPSDRDDFDLSDLSGVNDASTEITEEEEALLGSLEEKSRQESGGESLGDMDDFSFDAPEESAVDDDFSFPDIEDMQTKSAGAADDDEIEIESDAGSAGDDFALPQEESLSDDSAGESFDLDFDLEEPPAEEDEKDTFDDIAAVEREMTAPAPESAPEPEAGPETEEEPEIEVEEKPEIEIEEDPEPEPEVEQKPEPEPDVEPEIEEEPEIEVEEKPEIEIEEESEAEPDTEPEPEVEQEPAAGPEPQVEPEPPAPAVYAPPAAAQDGSAGILLKIEEELASIKSELAELKKELSGLRVAGVSSAAPGAEDHHKAQGGDSGFFADDEDEDETIALTGDELDNILSTADITEEDGESDIPDDILNFNVDAPPPSAEDIALDFSEPEAQAPAAALPGQEEILPDTEAAAGVDLDQDIQEEISADAGFAVGDTDLDLELDDKTEISIEDAEPEASSPGESLDLGEGDFSIDMTDSASAMEEKAPGDIISLDDAPAAAENIPLTTPEEQAIIEEYNRELDNFGAEDIRLETVAEETISETIMDEAAVPGEEEADVEFDLDSLQESAGEPEAEIETGGEEEPSPEAFEEKLDEIEIPAQEAEAPAKTDKAPAGATVDGVQISENVKEEIKSVLKYMDQLLESLPEDKIQEFAHSEHFDVYRRLFEELELE